MTTPKPTSPEQRSRDRDALLERIVTEDRDLLDRFADHDATGSCDRLATGH